MTPVQAVVALLGSSWHFVRGYTGGTAPNSTGHHGWDLSAALGTPIPSMTAGTVVFAENAGGGGPGFVGPYVAPANAINAQRFWATNGGNTVIIQAADGTRYQYAHMSAFGVKVGDTVSVGTLLGKVGQTGDATGPHVHFAMINAARTAWVDPTTFLTSLALSGKISVITSSTTANANQWNSVIACMPSGTRYLSATNAAQLQACAAKYGVPLPADLSQYYTRTMSDVRDALASAGTIPAANEIPDPIQSLVDIAGKLVDPMTYVHTGAFLIGVVLLFIGFRWVAQSGGATGQAVG